MTTRPNPGDRRQSAGPPAHLGIAIATRRLILRAVIGSKKTVITRDEVLNVCEPAQVVRRIADAVDVFYEDLEQNGLRRRFDSVGVSIGGHVDRSTGHVMYAPGLVFDEDTWCVDDFQKEPFAKMLSSALDDTPAIVENDANCMAEFERLDGQGKDVKDFATIYIAPDIRGIGCGIVINGQLVHGVSGGAGEFGHVVVLPEGPRCRCGNRGCLQAMASLETLLRNINWGNRKPVLTLKDASDLVADNDERAIKAFERGGKSLGQGVATLLNLVSPSRIILGGPPEIVPTASPSASSEVFISAVRESMERHSFSSLSQNCEICYATLDLEVAATGAAQIAADAWEKRESLEDSS